MVIRIYLTLEPEERRAIDKLADRELRDPKDQLRILLREALYQRGLLDTIIPKNSYSDQEFHNGVEND